MDEEVQRRPGRGRGCGRSRRVDRDRGLDGLEDAAVGGGRGGAADRGRRGCGLGRVSNVDRQRLVNAFEDGDNYHELTALLGIPYQTA